LDFSAGITYFLGRLNLAFLAPGSHISLFSLASALVIALLVLAFRRYKRGRRIRLRALLRALFPRRIVTSPSSRADVGYFYFNLFVFGIVFGWALLSYETLSQSLVGILTATFGPMPPAPLPGFATRGIITVMAFLAYELGYWFNHYLSHRIPFLWEFHKVHHSATVLTPLTNFRVHPVYMCIFLNILAVSIGLATGISSYLLGQPALPYGLSDTNLILVLFIYVYVHLQHSELWIAFTGWFGRLFMSPAHHQIHHSRNLAHFNKNMGSCLALWDWMFGTLYIPSQQPEKLEFGVEPDREQAHTVKGELIAPFVRGAVILKESFERRARPVPLPAPEHERA